MKKNITILILFFLIVGFFGQNIYAQNRGGERRTSRDGASRRSSSRSTSNLETKNDSVPKDSVKIYGWKISSRLGERIPIVRDTSFIDFHQTTLVDGKDVAVGYLGNIGSPAQSKIFFNRPETSRYIFLDAFSYWYKKPEDHIFLNTKVPYSNIFYQTSGGDEDGEERFQSEISSNFGKKLNVGVNFDYLYSRGHYTSLYNKQFTYDVYASYIGDKYKMHAFFSNNYFNNSENGGLSNGYDSKGNKIVSWHTYITNPDEAKRLQEDVFKGDSKDIPVNATGVWNRLQGRRFYVTNKYDLGQEMETVWVNDSTQVTRPKENYVSLASVIYTMNYTDQRRRLRANNNLMDNFFRDELGQYYDNGPADTVKYNDNLNDFMSYYSLKNTVAFAMNEGFREWTKFGLTVFAEYDMRRYSIPNYSLRTGNFPNVQKHEKDDALNIGGVLSKEKGKYLRYHVLAEKNLRDEDFRLDGELTTMLFFKDKQMSLKANAYIKNISPSMFERKFASKYINWDKGDDLKAVRRAYAGGEINIPFLKARISGGFETIQNYIYYDYRGVVQQSDEQINVMSLRLDHKFKVGILHWDNQFVFQKSTKEDILPLPTWSFYSNLYLQTKIAKVLDLQLGVDAHYHTEYDAPGYNFVTMQFTNQDPNEKFKIGNYPMATAYLNLNLKYTRFFIMYYNAAQSIMGNPNYFSLYKYPLNPSIIKFGLSWKFNN